MKYHGQEMLAFVVIQAGILKMGSIEKAKFEFELGICSMWVVVRPISVIVV